MKRESENWQQVVADVRRIYGLTYAGLGRILGMNQSGIRMIGIGRTKEPRYSVGTQLLFMLKSRQGERT